MFCWLAFAVQLFSHFHCHLSLGQGAIHLRVTAVDLQVLLPVKIWKSRLSKSGSLVSKAHNSSGCPQVHLQFLIFFLNCGHTFEFDRTSRQRELLINPQKMKLIVRKNHVDIKINFQTPKRLMQTEFPLKMWKLIEIIQVVHYALSIRLNNVLG